jgi:hypothetical protein
LDATVALARRRGLIGSSSDLVAIDSTGLETRHVSRYYSQRCERIQGHYKHRYPKLSAVSDVQTHLFLGVVIDRGPKPDDIEFHRLARLAHRRHPFQALLGDVGYDGEHHHRFLYYTLGVLGIIPPHRGRPAKIPSRSTRGFFRSLLRAHWPIAEFGQRWQIETDFSMLKRLLDCELRSRKHSSIDHELYLRALTLNLMIIRSLLRSFQQSRCLSLIL